MKLGFVKTVVDTDVSEEPAAFVVTVTDYVYFWFTHPVVQKSRCAFCTTGWVIQKLLSLAKLCPSTDYI
jgi:hypothetical protein